MILSPIKSVWKFSLLVLCIIFIFDNNEKVSRVSAQVDNNAFHCSDTWCAEWTLLNPCEKARNCTTIGQRKFLDPSPCNCCEYCYDYIPENSTCSPISYEKPIEMCGPQLECMIGNEDESSCKPSTIGPKGEPSVPPDPEHPIPDPNFCLTKRKEYMDAKESGKGGIGQFLPVCDALGNYAPRQCVLGSLCYCSNAKGGRIFGESLPNELQNCACGRDVDRLQEFGFKGRWPHCLPNGDYDELQCVVRSCYCRSFPNDIFPPQNITRLRCFNESIHVHDKEALLYYVRPCEYRLFQLEIEIKEAELNGRTIMIVADMPRCSPDGNYGSIQSQKEKLFCSYPMNGTQIENYEAPKQTQAAKEMNCYCARARYLLSNSVTGKPKCCANGNYRPWQCIGSRCFCVDSLGHQRMDIKDYEVRENDIASLPCYKATAPGEDPCDYEDSKK